jgi:membrane protease YdiL (CAAX protease family)
VNSNLSATLPRERIGLPLVVFLVFALSWPSTLPQIIASWDGPQSVPGWMRPLQFLLVAPGLVALWAAWMNGGRAGLRRLAGKLVRWRASAGIYFAVLVGPPLLMCAAIAIGNAFGWSHIAMPDAATLAAKVGPTLLVYLILNTEELAWRGYVLPRMQRRWNPLTASLVLGAVWIVFHAPYFLMRGGHPGGFTPLLFVLALMPVSVLLARTCNATLGSVLLPHLLHQSINAWAESLPFLPRFAGTSVPLEIGIALATVVTIVAIVVRPPMWTRENACTDSPRSDQPG